MTGLTHFTDCYFTTVKPLEEWHRPVKKYLDVTSTRPTNWTKAQAKEKINLNTEGSGIFYSFTYIPVWLVCQFVPVRSLYSLYHTLAYNKVKWNCYCKDIINIIKWPLSKTNTSCKSKEYVSYSKLPDIEPSIFIPYDTLICVKTRKHYWIMHLFL